MLQFPIFEEASLFKARLSTWHLLC